MKIVINTDAHSIDMLENMDVGVSTAKRGWLKKSSVLNAQSEEDLITFLRRD